MKELLSVLSNLNGVSGYEEEVRDFILQQIKPYAQSITVDALGNIIVFKKGKKTRASKVMFAAHMDEVGFLVTDATDEGYIKIGSVGSIDPRVIIGRVLEIGKNKIKGIVPLKAIHLTTAEERKVAPKLKDLYLDTGSIDKKEVLGDEENAGFTHLGDTICFSTKFSTFGENLMKGKALDDRAGCCILIKMIQSPLEYDTYFAFTVQEEVGMRGAQIVANRIQPDTCIIVEGTSACDLPDVEKDKVSTKLGKGPALSLVDGRTLYPSDLREKIIALAQAKGIKWQYRLSSNGGTDAGAFHVSGKGCKVLGISLPVRYIHTANCVANYDDLLQTEKFAFAIANGLEE